MRSRRGRTCLAPISPTPRPLQHESPSTLALRRERPREGNHPPGSTAASNSAVLPATAPQCSGSRNAPVATRAAAPTAPAAPPRPGSRPRPPSRPSPEGASTHRPPWYCRRSPARERARPWLRPRLRLPGGGGLKAAGAPSALGQTPPASGFSLVFLLVTSPY
ncbi:uncharacterized protein LOC116419212 [Sarcophilus harrisii]|uniref:uncharacterized protein LOC116419212 n=1 Tax=Sarcophilus harrisii TaxID=9305 RepID=UPI001301CB0C|nr:uncharacterized protein LOC116419212 [Sarcophilus harrisii]